MEKRRKGGSEAAFLETRMRRDEVLEGRLEIGELASFDHLKRYERAAQSKAIS